MASSKLFFICLLILFFIQLSFAQENCWSESLCNCKILDQSFCDNQVLSVFRGSWDKIKNSLDSLKSQLTNKTQELLLFQQQLTDVNIQGPKLAQTFDNYESGSEDFSQLLRDNFGTFQETANALMEQLPQLFPMTSEDSYSTRSKELVTTLQQVFISSIIDQAMSDTQTCLYEAINNGGISFETYFGLPSPTVGFKIQFERPSLVPCLTEKKKLIIARATDNWNKLKANGNSFASTIDMVFNAAVVLKKKIEDIQRVKSSAFKSLCYSPVNSTMSNVQTSILNWLNRLGQGVTVYGRSAFGDGGLGSLFAKLKEGACNDTMNNALLNMTTTIIRYYSEGRSNSLPAVLDGLFTAMSLSGDRLQSFLSSPQSAVTAEICNQPALSAELKKVCNIVGNTSSSTTQRCFHKYFNLNQMVYHHGVELSLKPFKFVSLQSGYDCKTLDCWMCVNGFTDVQKRSVEGTEANEQPNSLGQSTNFWADSLASFQAANVLASCDPSSCTSGTFNSDTCECQPNNDDGRLSGPVIAAIVIVCVVVSAVAIALGVFLFLKRRQVEHA